MKQLHEIYKAFAGHFEYWLPDFSHAVIPRRKNGEFVRDSKDGFDYYCEWLTGYLMNNHIPVCDYQAHIIKKLRRERSLRSPYSLGLAGISCYCFAADGLEYYPPDFLDNPDPGRLSAEYMKNFMPYLSFPKFRGFNPGENLQAALVFEYISLKQNELFDRIKGPKWLDIGWRALLKEGLLAVRGKKERITYTRCFINEMGYLSSK